MTKAEATEQIHEMLEGQKTTHDLANALLALEPMHLCEKPAGGEIWTADMIDNKIQIGLSSI